MSNQKYETVASLNYPSYAVTAVGGRHVVVGGGGGSAKTGIKNQFVRAYTASSLMHAAAAAAAGHYGGHSGLPLRGYALVW